MNRDYINWLETLPCNRKPQKVNVWMGGWAPLPEEIDLSGLTVMLKTLEFRH